MENKHYSRKQRQLKYLVKQLNNLLQKADDDLKSEIKAGSSIPDPPMIPIFNSLRIPLLFK